MDSKSKVDGTARKAVTKIGASPKSASSRQSIAAKKTVVAASSQKSGRAAQQASRTPHRLPSDALVCRYCRSDDLAPSFKKRRDARCRACFKKRYASSGKKTKRAGKTKASK